MVLTCCCVPNFTEIGSRVRAPDAHNCRMFNAPLLATASWRTCRGHDGMRPPKCHRNRSIDRRVTAFPTFCNMAAVRHLKYELCYSGLPRSQLCGSITLSKFGIDPVFSAGEIAFYNFAILAEECLTTPPPFLLGAVGGSLDPLILWVVIQTPKRHILR